MAVTSKKVAKQSAFPYFAEFVKFSTGFALIVAVALFVLRAAMAATQNVAF